MAKAVSEGEIKSVSASAFNTFDLCQRKWRLKYVERIPEPERNADADEGENIHLQMQAYYEGGPAPTNASCVAMLKDAPPRELPGIRAEQPRDFKMNTSISGVPVKGKIDLTLPPVDGAGAIWDWKSKSESSIKRVPGAKALSKDNQAIIYGDYYFHTYPETQTVTFTHANVLRGKGKTYKIVSTPPLSREHVAAGIATLADTVEDMKAVANLPTWQDAEPTWSACRLYPPAGCPFASMCNEAKNSVSVSQGLAELFAGDEDAT